MFTGLVEEIGRVKEIKRSPNSASLTIQAKEVLEGIRLGDSIAVNGACLTVIAFDSNGFTVDVMPETMDHTNLSGMKPGSLVNLERALSLGDRLGGHLVSGHVDGMGEIRELKKDENAVRITISASQEILRYMVPRGSIAVDGVSLTLTRVEATCFQVSVIPHTRTVTALLTRKAGDQVNLEADMLAKYVERLLKIEGEETVPKGLDRSFLSQHGFLV